MLKCKYIAQGIQSMPWTLILQHFQCFAQLAQDGACKHSLCPLHFLISSVITLSQSLDELDDDDGGEKDRREEEEELVQANTFQNESMTADPATGYLLETPRSGSGRYKSFPQMGLEEDTGGNSRQRHNRHGRDGGASAPGSLEKRIEDLERELARERQENARLLKAYQDKDDLIGKLKEEIDLLNQDLDDIEDENEQLKQENKTLLKVVGQLTR
ncbi:PRKC apoptosis WT1 regulator protein-like [Astatotilapia calliptera]|uniref:PRKC apoptosis WT1 regulator protein-like n=1 Tax=Astatotilapia calliptera TaxID=8154 RepID=UPI000E41FD5F|nr:PRKC apoptosis WT1 regulator protein-like [Astatotilapia calliptera]